METEPRFLREATSAIIGDDPGLPGDPETLKLGRWVGVNGRGRSQYRGPAPFSAGARDGKAELHGDRVCCSHFSRETSRVALLAARGGAGKAGNIQGPGGGSPQRGASWVSSLWVSGQARARFYSSLNPQGVSSGQDYGG